jgi:dihydroorotate dehydrogenase subfamily 2
MNIKIVGSIYQRLLKPIFFLIDPETVHNTFLIFGQIVGKTPPLKAMFRMLFGRQRAQNQKVFWGITFPSIVGLPAGYDKEGVLVNTVDALGFGFTTVGTVTFGSYAGNSAPRLTRLTEDNSLAVNYGLNSTGAANVVKRIKATSPKVPVVISIGKTNQPYTVDIEAGIEDYLKTYQTFQESGVGDIYEINISCPNTSGGEPFTEPRNLERLLTALCLEEITKPIWLKMPISVETDQFKELVSVAAKFEAVKGLNIGNLNKKYDPSKLKTKIGPFKGNLSGKMTWERSNELLRMTKEQWKDRFVLIGTGGIFSVEDARIKLECGADLICILTGLIYTGPQLVSEINMEVSG